MIEHPDMQVPPNPPAHPDMQALSAYLDGELDALENRDVTAHLCTCSGCADVVRDLQAISLDLRAWVAPAPPVDLVGRISAALDSPRPSRSRPGRWRHWLPSSIGAAASLLLGLLLGSAWLPGQPVSSPPGLNALAVLGSAPPGALCTRPESCYLKVILK